MGAKKTSVSMTPVEHEIVEAVVRERGLSFSGALRFILREWFSSKDGDRFKLTDKGKDILDEHQEGMR